MIFDTESTDMFNAESSKGLHSVQSMYNAERMLLDTNMIAQNRYKSISSSQSRTDDAKPPAIDWMQYLLQKEAAAQSVFIPLIGDHMDKCVALNSKV